MSAGSQDLAALAPCHQSLTVRMVYGLYALSLSLEGMTARLSVSKCAVKPPDLLVNNFEVAIPVSSAYGMVLLIGGTFYEGKFVVSPHSR